MTTTRAWHLAARPDGVPAMSDFELKPLELPELQDGMVLVQNRWLSVDPYMRGRMNDVKSYVPPFAVGAPLEGGALGTVVESRASELQPGDTVLHMQGWRETSAGPAKLFQKVPDLGLPEQLWLGNLGLTGATAWFGLLKVAEAKEGETVFVSAAAGAVGSAVVQIAKARGMRVIGSAGGADKCAFLREIGADAAIDYKEGPVVKALATAAPDGIDVYFDNVGGEHLDAALAHARQGARFAVCGMIDIYNGGETRLRYLARVIAARIRIQGFLVMDYAAELPGFHREMAALIAQGRVQSRETVREGIDAVPAAFIDLFSGGNIGKMLVRL